MCIVGRPLCIIRSHEWINREVVVRAFNVDVLYNIKNCLEVPNVYSLISVCIVFGYLFSLCRKIRGTFSGTICIEQFRHEINKKCKSIDPHN